jgi:phosphate/sulfate permease
MPSTILLFGLLLIYVAITGRFIAFLNGAKAMSSIFKLSAGANALDPKLAKKPTTVTPPVDNTPPK